MKLIEIVKDTFLIDDHFLDILDTFAKMPRYHTSRYRDQDVLELWGSFGDKGLKKMFDEDPKGFKNSIDSFPAFEWDWLIRDFIRAIKGKNVLEKHFADIIRFFEDSILKRRSISSLALFLELFEAIKDTELLKHHYSAMLKLFREITIPSEGYAYFKEYLEAKKYFEEDIS